MTRRWIAGPLVATLLAAPSPAQDKAPPKPVPAADVTEAEAAFDAAVRATARAIRVAPGYTLTATSAWKRSDAGGDRAGTNVVVVRAAEPGRFRIDATTPDAPAAGVTVAADGGTITRLSWAANAYAVTPTDRPTDDLQADGLTVPALQAVGIDWLLHPDLHGAVAAQVVRVEDLGVRAFRVALASGAEVEVRFGADALPVSVTSTRRVPVGEKLTVAVALTTKLAWDMTVPPADAFRVAVPAGATKIDDVTELTGEGVAGLVGRPAPAVAFAGLDGKPVALAARIGKGPVVVYYWATWAAPSAEDMPDLNRFVAGYAAKGVKFLAVNVGESAEYVKAFAAKVGYSGEVALDPAGAAMAALWLRGVPAAVVIGPDGSVRAVHRGTREAVRKGVQDDLNKLLAVPAKK